MFALAVEIIIQKPSEEKKIMFFQNYFLLLSCPLLHTLSIEKQM